MTLSRLSINKNWGTSPKIYEVDSEVFADEVVFKATNQSISEIKGNIGVWFFCNNPSMAQVKIGKVSRDIFADIKVFYTNSIIFAHWNNEEKKEMVRLTNKIAINLRF